MPLLSSLLQRLKRRQLSTDDYVTPSFPSSETPPIPPPSSKAHLAQELQQRLEQPSPPPPPLPPRTDRQEPPTLPPRSSRLHQVQQHQPRQSVRTGEYMNPDVFANQEPPPLPPRTKRTQSQRPQSLRAQPADESDPHSPRYSRACAVCFEPHPRVRVVLTACGHAVCRDCADALADGDGSLDCPLCRARTGYVRLFEDLETLDISLSP